MVTFINDIFETSVFLSAFIAWLMAQSLKAIISIVSNLRLKNRAKSGLSREEIEDIRTMRDMMSSLFWKTGGMPSSHAAMSCALSTAIGFERGFTSELFFVTFFFTTIVLRDATGVRLLAGRLAKLTNLLVDKHNEKLSIEKHLDIIKVVEGHSVSEVFVGMVLGIFVSIIIYLF